VEKLLREALGGDIALPIVWIETSQKGQRGVHLVDLAAYIDMRRAAAVKECRQLTGRLRYDRGATGSVETRAKPKETGADKSIGPIINRGRSPRCLYFPAYRSYTMLVPGAAHWWSTRSSKQNHLRTASKRLSRV
jgi:hypothetical protein